MRMEAESFVEKIGTNFDTSRAVEFAEDTSVVTILHTVE